MKVRGRLGIGAILLILGGFGAWLFALHLLEPSPRGFLALDDPLAAQAMIATLSRASVTLISALLASLFLAIPLTASMYTPQLIDLFVRSWTNRLVLGLFVLSAGHSIWINRLAVDDFVPRIHILVALGLVTLSLAVLLPYLFSVFRFLDPDTIIARVAGTVIDAMRPEGGVATTRRQQRLVRRVGHLGNLILRSVERADREVALRAVEAVEECAGHYLEVKGRQPEEWFTVGPAHFPGLGREAVALLNRQRTWVEMALLRQLSRAYDFALARMPDVLGAISRANRRLAVRASGTGDTHGEPGVAGVVEAAIETKFRLEVLDLAIRFFNNFLREAVKRKDPHALYDVLYQYRLVAEALWESQKDRVTRIAASLDRYGRMAAEAGIPFAQDLVAYDLGSLIALAARSARAEAAPGGQIHALRSGRGLYGPADLAADRLIEILLGVERPAPDSGIPRLSAGMVKARILLAARLAEAGDEARARRVEASLSGLPRDLIAAAGADLAGAEESFWEVTDRQQNLDFVDPPLRGRVDAILARLGGGG